MHDVSHFDSFGLGRRPATIAGNAGPPIRRCWPARTGADSFVPGSHTTGIERASGNAGDAVLGVIVCDELFHRYPEACEGEMTRIKSVVVSREVCGRMTRKLGLDEFIRVGKGISSSGQVPESVEAAVMEAVIGAMYIDGGLEAARPFVLSILSEEIDFVSDSVTGVNHKSLLQQFSQRQFSETPAYIILDEKGPDHAKCFLVSAMIGSKVYAPAWGPSKKDAEQRAAENALAQLDGSDPVYIVA